MAGARLRRGGLPVCRDRFFGRDGDIAEIAELLRTGRLVTLTGPPGMGKSRLALEVATRIAGRYPDGVRWVDLSLLGASDGLVPALRAAWTDAAGYDATMTGHAAGTAPDCRGMLIVLDGCHGGLLDLAPVVDNLLRRAAGLSILATSQSRLLVAGERPWPVPPMRIPDPEEVAEAMSGYDAVALFCDRATTVSSRFRLTPQMAPTVAEVCRRLDGMPLAIEFVAANTAGLSPADMAHALDERFAVLERAGAGFFSRRHSVLSALEDSYGWLGGPERVLLRRLSVFDGGATLDAIEDICAGGELEQRSVFDLLGSLVAKSFVSMNTTAREVGRYRMLETVREFARLQLAAAGEAPQVHGRHAAWFVKFAENAESCLIDGGDQRAAIEGLRREEPNLSSVAEWSSAEGHAEWALRLACAMTPFWASVGHRVQGRHRIEEALIAAQGTQGELWARALWASGFLAGGAGDQRSARIRIDEALSVYCQLGDVRGYARCLVERGAVLLFTDGPIVARPVLEDSLVEGRIAGDWSTVRGLCICASACFQEGEMSPARALWEEALDLARTRRNHRALAVAMLGLGTLHLAQGDFRAADIQLNDVLVVARELSDDEAAANALRLLGELAIDRGDFDRAGKVLEDSVAMYPGPGQPPMAVAVLGMYSRGRLALATGHPDRAASCYAEAVELARVNGVSSAAALLGLGRAAAALGQPERARARMEAALSVARVRGERLVMSDVLYHLGTLARLRGDYERAAASTHEALTLQGQFGLLPAVAESLEAMAGLAVIAQRVEHAARLFGAAQTMRDTNGSVRCGDGHIFYEGDVAIMRLGGAKVQSAWAQGAGMSVADAISYASRGRGSRNRPTSGWDALSGTEHAVAVLAAEGLRNKEISERLFISPRTVASHLGKIFAKLGVASRTDLVNHAHSRDPEDLAPSTSEGGQMWPVPGAALA